MVDLVTLSESRLYDPDCAKHGNVTVPKEALRLLIWHFWTRPPSKMPLSSGEKLTRDKVFIEFRKELDRRVATGETYKDVLHELSKKAAAKVSGYALSQHGRILSITENTAKRYIQSPGSKPCGKRTAAALRPRGNPNDRQVRRHRPPAIARPGRSAAHSRPPHSTRSAVSMARRRAL